MSIHEKLHFLLRFKKRLRVAPLKKRANEEKELTKKIYQSESDSKREEKVKVIEKFPFRFPLLTRYDYMRADFSCRTISISICRASACHSCASSFSQGNFPFWWAESEWKKALPATKYSTSQNWARGSIQFKCAMQFEKCVHTHFKSINP